MKATLSIDRIIDNNISVPEHFEAAAALYREWSPVGHLHFGYYTFGSCPLFRNQQLEAMVNNTVERLNIHGNKHIADIGCGYGTAAIHSARKMGIRVDGFTNIEEQVNTGNIAKKEAGVDDLVRLYTRDFRHTEMSDNSYDGAYALESICYGTGAGKQDVLQEVHRILKPGANISLVDGFILERTKPGSFRGGVLQKVTKGWAVDQFANKEAFIEALHKVGFKNVRVRDLSLRVAPTAMHAPHLIVLSFLKRLIMLDPMRRKERAHLASCFWGLILGMFRKNFRYLQITATKEL